MKTALWILLLIGLIGSACGGWYYYKLVSKDTLPEYIASGNGRLEAVEYDIATKYAGRLEEVLVEEGEMVERGQVLARMNTDTIKTQISEAQALLEEAHEKRRYAEAIVQVRQSELTYATKAKDRSVRLLSTRAVSQQQVDQDLSQYETAKAALQAAKIQVIQAKAGVKATEARIERLNAELAEMQLVSPINGRVLYKIAETEEVLGSGGKVLSLLDLTDVYMTIFLPTSQAGKIAIGSDARIIIDAVPQYVIPATVTFVAPQAQFTPKAVETRTEREKLMFRVKIKIESTLLKKYVQVVKTGIPGEAFILLDQNQDWPEHLHVKLPQ